MGFHFCLIFSILVVVITMIYFIYGENDQLIKRKIDEIFKKDDIDKKMVSNYDLEEQNISELVIDARTLFLFGDKKILVGRNASFLSGSKKKLKFEHDLEMFNEFLDHDSDDFLLVLTMVSKKPDKRKKIVEKLMKVSEVIPIEVLEGNNLSNFIIEEFRSRGFIIESKTANFFKERVHNKFILIPNEIEKICLFLETKEVTEEVIEKLVAKPFDDNIFALTEAVAQKKPEEAVLIYRDLIMQKIMPPQIIALLASQFRLILKVKYLSEERKVGSEIAAALGVHPYRVKLANKLALQYSKKDLINMLKNLIELDFKTKSSPVNSNTEMEIFFLKI